ncbi:putative Ribonuclease 2 [Tripterygium wilfordii]|uniref:Putative Ribonuclease 2 n=1 Tax=Tripterygium wilfordii TaxID=458696 RepID=A0A7J7D703_TRIWF|nr:ribonuclease 1-like [Tripterygium wilfordii]KAF5742083.1 putative Ribonuclease 2 [Tripterygium wilfordii]
MARKLSVGAYILAILITCSSAVLFNVGAIKIGLPDYYRTAVRWPQSYCNTGKFVCAKPTPFHFIIHALIPMYHGHEKVPQFNKTGCTHTQPKTEKDINNELLAPLGDELRINWPSLGIEKHYLKLWRYGWKLHGMCSEFADHPFDYFDKALSLVRQHDFMLELIRGSGPKNHMFEKRCP